MQNVWVRNHFGSGWFLGLDMGYPDWRKKERLTSAESRGLLGDENTTLFQGGVRLKKSPRLIASDFSFSNCKRPSASVDKR